MSNEFTEQSITSFRTRAQHERRILDLVDRDLATLQQVGALDSFVSTFSETSGSLFNLLSDRLSNGYEAFAEQVESSSDPLEYVDNNGCQWLFDVRKPHLGWV